MNLHNEFTLLENFNLIFFENNLNKFKFKLKKNKYNLHFIHT